MTDPHSGQQVLRAELGTCLVTGGAGFIGSHLAAALQQAGASVRLLDDLSAGSLDRVPASLRDSVLVGSLLDDAVLARAVEGVDTVFHLAALTSVPESWDHPAHCEEINGLGTARLLERSLAAGVRRLVYAASSSCYASAATPRAESDALDPVSPYAVSKLAGEGHLLAHARAGRIEGVSLRLFNVYGPGQRADSPYSGVISRFVHQVGSGQTPTVHGDGGQTRDFVHAADVVAAFLCAARASAQGAGQAFNIGTGVHRGVAGTDCRASGASSGSTSGAGTSGRGSPLMCRRYEGTSGVGLGSKAVSSGRIG